MRQTSRMAKNRHSEQQRPFVHPMRASSCALVGLQVEGFGPHNPYRTRMGKVKWCPIARNVWIKPAERLSS